MGYIIILEKSIKYYINLVYKILKNNEVKPISSLSRDLLDLIYLFKLFVHWDLSTQSHSSTKTHLLDKFSRSYALVLNTIMPNQDTIV